MYVSRKEKNTAYHLVENLPELLELFPFPEPVPHFVFPLCHKLAFFDRSRHVQMSNGIHFACSSLCRQSHVDTELFCSSASDIFSLHRQIHDEAMDIWNDKYKAEGKGSDGAREKILGGGWQCDTTLCKFKTS